MGAGKKNKKQAFGEAEFSTWVTARDAYEAVSLAFKDYAVARGKLLTRLSARLIDARAEYTYVHDEDGEEKLKPTQYLPVNPSVWREITKNPRAYAMFWESGDLVIPTADAAVRFLDVRFNRDQVAKLAPQFVQPRPGVIPAKESEQETEKRPVAKADLARWAEVFVKVHPDFGEPFAHRSARAMFPDNSVGRDRMREALTAAIGPRKRGPKPAK